nr:MAG: phosphoprotein [Tomato betanucleorhabdovirus 2]
MNTEGYIHPKYAGLPDTATHSEVMASKYAAEVSKLDDDTDKEFVLGSMAEWALHFREEGLNVAEKHLAVFGELSLALQNAGKGDLTGKVAITIADAMKATLMEGRAAAVSVEKLELISDSFLRGIEGLKRATESLISHVPKKQLKASRKTKPSPIVIADGKLVEQEKKKDPEQPSCAEEECATMELEEGSKDDPPKGENELNTSKEPQPVNDQSALDVLKAQVRNHYSDTEFDSYGDNKKLALIYYYIEHMLGVSQSVVNQDPELRQMLFDIVDKRRVIRLCNKAREGTITATDLTEATEEAQDAIDACSKIYGKYKGEVVYSGETPVLVVISIP